MVKRVKQYSDMECCVISLCYLESVNHDDLIPKITSQVYACIIHNCLPIKALRRHVEGAEAMLNVFF
jgi:hypothetical protein